MTHISDRVRGELQRLGFTLQGDTWSRLVEGVDDQGQLSDGARVINLRICDAGRWFELVDGWGVLLKDCDLRDFTGARAAVRHLCPQVLPVEPAPVVVQVHGEPVTLTPATIEATREWFADNGRGCIADARDGTTRVNDLESYVAWREEGIAASLRGDSDRTFAFLQRAVSLQTGECVPLLAR